MKVNSFLSPEDLIVGIYEDEFSNCPTILFIFATLT
jgi:hypothetical protein